MTCFGPSALNGLRKKTQFGHSSTCGVVGTGYRAAQNGTLFLPFCAQSEGFSLETCCRQLSQSHGI
ncbi:hypothetical protein EYF80_001100 [Liparis tanakae]|uniref:Uncharacterized protein n=1 Tax=Liparis tanakae TaxID=230148 RepID=A0A4Z2JGH6_9TELE|nr:hypothetical protein EYF80_001100 [Liparis tanakae]